MLTDIKIKNLKPRDKLYKVADRDGLYVAITPAGTVSFRFDYRLHSRRETLAIGRYDESRGREVPRELGELTYGMDLSLAEARLLLTQARRSVEMGESTARAKAEKRTKQAEFVTFGSWADKYFEEVDIAESTRSMRQAIYDRDIKKPFGRLKLEEISSSLLLALCERIKKERDAPATAVHVRDIVLQIYRWVQFKSKIGQSMADTLNANVLKEAAEDEARVQALLAKLLPGAKRLYCG